MSVAIRRPTHSHDSRRPDVAVVRRVLPAAVIVEILVAGHVLGHVAPRLRLLGAAVAPHGPVVESIGGPERARVGRQGARSPERNHLLTAYRNRLPAPAGLGPTFADLHDGGITGIVDLDAIRAGPLQRQGDVRRIDLVCLVGEQLAHVNDEGSGGDAHLRRVVVEVQERESCRAAQANDRRARVELSARVLVGPQLVAGGKRAVDHRRRPVLHSRRLQ